ncbi:type VII toxin-antitoxin system MntA family adenylyltransferase antitoxin [Methylomicrobium lacus]|uniref:type VII toxin-antitoxin system MntA family adenylyltransferase antitoxin n=1 Tax=Methylomicrobium lacus TaxID=136992 RepID=UPI00045EC5F6|nr:nucleotidyltransferase domain-containing protein [Methylomicrobium lacus]
MNNKLRQASQSLELKQALQSVLAKQEGVRLAILFGSLASGTARAESDLDVAVDAGHPLDAAEKMQLIGDLAAATGRPIDLVDLQSVGEPLLGQILRYGKRLIGNDTYYGDLISKHLFEQADFMPYRNRILADRRKAWIGK